MQKSTEVNTELIGNTNTISSIIVSGVNSNSNITSHITNQIQLINSKYIPIEGPKPIGHIPLTLNIIRQNTTNITNIPTETILETKQETIPEKENTRVNKNFDCKGVRSRSWFLTINNFTEQDVAMIKAEDTVYKVWQFEIGKSGTKHLHCLLYFKNARTWPKKRYPTARIEYPRSLNDCIVYCQKERTRVDGPWSEGTCPCQGRRTDLEELANAIREGTSLRDIATTNGAEYIRYHHGLKALREIYLKPRNWRKKPHVTWIYGASGTGKTRCIFEEFDTGDITTEDIYVKENNKWFDGYTQQKVFLWDEISPTGCPLVDFLKIFDRYPCQRETKGGHVHINSGRMFITSSKHPLDMYSSSDNNDVEIMRRLDVIIKINNDESIEIEKDSDYEWVD